MDEKGLPETEPQRKIIDATIECIERVGLQGVTVRKIAEEAGVNIAAINYYFRSKDLLVERAMEQTLHNIFDDWYEWLADPNADLHAVLYRMLEEVIVGSIRYPGISRAHLFAILVEQKTDTPFTVRFRKFLSDLQRIIAAAHPSASDRMIQNALRQLFSAAFFPSLVPAVFFADTPPSAMLDQDERQTYIQLILDSFVAALESDGAQ